MSICAYAQERLERHWYMCYTRTSMEDGVGGDDVSWRWRMGRTVWLGLRNVPNWRSQVQKQVLNAADGWRLWDKKAKKLVHRRSKKSKKRTRKSSKVGSTYWRVFTSQVLFFGLPLNQQHTISDTCHPTRMQNAHMHWCMARRKASHACVLLFN